MTGCRIGNILKDEGKEYVDEVSTQRSIDSLKVRTPRDVKIDRNDEEVATTQIKYQKERICRSTPYLDDNAGLMFPSPKLDKPPPNSLIHNIDDREESSVIGNFIYGNGREDFTRLEKNKGDLRLQLPNGLCLYIWENGEVYLQTSETPTTIPEQNLSKQHFMMKQDGTIRINLSENRYIEINSDGSMKFYNTATQYIELTSTGDVKIHNSDNQYVELTTNGDIKVYNSATQFIEMLNTGSLKAQNKANHLLELAVDGSVKLKKNASNYIQIDAVGNAIVESQTTVKLKAAGAISTDGIVTKLQNGNTPLAHGAHTHTTPSIIGNLGYPVTGIVPANTDMTTTTLAD